MVNFLKRVERYSNIEWKKILSGGKVLPVLFLVCFVWASSSVSGSVNVLEAMKENGDGLGVFEVYGVYASQMSLLVTECLGFLFLFMDYPKNGEDGTGAVLRCGRMEWFLGQVLCILKSAVLYCLLLWLFLIVLYHDSIIFSVQWQDIFADGLLEKKYFFIGAGWTAYIAEESAPVLFFLVSFLGNVLCLTLASCILMVLNMYKNGSGCVLLGGILLVHQTLSEYLDSGIFLISRWSPLMSGQVYAYPQLSASWQFCYEGFLFMLVLYFGSRKAGRYDIV